MLGYRNDRLHTRASYQANHKISVKCIFEILHPTTRSNARTLGSVVSRWILHKSTQDMERDYHKRNRSMRHCIWSRWGIKSLDGGLSLTSSCIIFNFTLTSVIVVLSTLNTISGAYLVFSWWSAFHISPINTFRAEFPSVVRAVKLEIGVCCIALSSEVGPWVASRSIAKDAQSVLSPTGLIESRTHTVAIVGTVAAIWTTHTSIDWLADDHGITKGAVVIRIVVILTALLALWSSTHAIGSWWGTNHFSPIDILLADVASVIRAVNTEVGICRIAFRAEECPLITSGSGRKDAYTILI